MRPDERLYFADAALLDFDARVVETRPLADGVGVVLEVTRPWHRDAMLDAGVGQHGAIGSAGDALGAVGPDVDADDRVHAGLRSSGSGPG